MLQEGWNRGFMKAAETPWLPALLLAGSAFWVGKGLLALPDAASEYVQLFYSSRLIHATTVDFTLLTALAPFWMSVDAEGRQWEPR